MCEKLGGLFPLVRYAHLNWVAEATIPQPIFGTPNDPLFRRQGNLQPTSLYKEGHINMVYAWGRRATGRNLVRVGVLDTGIDHRHPDFALSPTTSVVTTGRNYVLSASPYDPNQPQDPVGHGTAVAGIIGAKRSNGTGIAGIAGGEYGASPAVPGVQLVDLRALDSRRNVTLDVMANAIQDGAMDLTRGGLGLNILNISVGTTGFGTVPSPNLLKDVIRTAYRNNCVVVAARGNGINEPASTVTAPVYPASLNDDWVISVGASGPNGRHKDMNNSDPNYRPDRYESSYGTDVDVIAPGTTALVVSTLSQNAPQNAPQVFNYGVPTTSPDPMGYTTFGGTSAAAPHVTGVAALAMGMINTPGNSANNLAPEDVEQLLQFTAKDLVRTVATSTYKTPTEDPNGVTGWGLLNAWAALEYANTSAYKFIHTTIRPNNPPVLVAQNKTIAFQGNYFNTSTGTAFPALQRYTANVYRVRTTVQVRQPNGNSPTPVPNPDDALLRVWSRNGASNLWGGTFFGAPVILPNPEPEIMVTTPSGPSANSFYYAQLANQNTVDVEGYAYLVTLPNGTNVWVPRDPNAGVRMDLTFYTYNVEKDFQYRRSTATGLSSVAYPNPTARNLMVAYEDRPDNGMPTVEVWSVTGRKVQQFMFPAAVSTGSRTLNLALPDLPTGLYTYRLTTAQGVSVGKFVKE